MRYFHSKKIERHENEILGGFFGKYYEPNGAVTIDRQTTIQLTNAKFTEIEGKTLAINPDTVSWAFLSGKEAEISRDLFSEETSFGHACDVLGYDLRNDLTKFTKRMFRRGLLTLNGMASVEPGVFNDSPNTNEGNLVELLLTEKCNLNCGYCLAGTNPHMPSMNEQIAFAAIDKAFSMTEAPDFTFEFSGGEPFMKFELFQALTSYIRNHPKSNGRTVYICAQTNATLLTEPKVKWLKENDISIGVSIDGDPASHNVSRPTINGTESFSKVIRGIKLLHEYDIPFGILVVLNASNIASPEALIAFLENYKLYSLKLNPIAFIGTARQNWNQVGLTNEQTLSYFKAFASLLVNGNHAIYEDNLQTMMQHIISKQRNNRCMRTHCGAGENFQAINAKGDIFPCGRSTQSPGLKIGNVLDPDVKTLSNAGLKNAFVRQIKERRPDDFVECASCNYKQMCQAGCSAQAFEKYGTVIHKTPECHYYKNMYPHLMHWLSFDEHAFSHFNAVNYFEKPAQLYHHQFFA